MEGKRKTLVWCNKTNMIDEYSSGAQNQDSWHSKTNFSIAIFLVSVLMYQKYQISLPVEYKTARPKTGDWE